MYTKVTEVCTMKSQQHENALIMKGEYKHEAWIYWFRNYGKTYGA